MILVASTGEMQNVFKRESKYTAIWNWISKLITGCAIPIHGKCESDVDESSPSAIGSPLSNWKFNHIQFSPSWNPRVRVRLHWTVLFLIRNTTGLLLHSGSGRVEKLSYPWLFEYLKIAQLENILLLKSPIRVKLSLGLWNPSVWLCKQATFLFWSRWRLTDCLGAALEVGWRKARVSSHVLLSVCLIRHSWNFLPVFFAILSGSREFSTTFSDWKKLNTICACKCMASSSSITP